MDNFEQIEKAYLAKFEQVKKDYPDYENYSNRENLALWARSEFKGFAI